MTTATKAAPAEVSAKTVPPAAVAPRPHTGSTLHTFGALLARDVRVLRRQVPELLVRAAMQPLAFVFVFTYVLPAIGMGGAIGASGHGPAFTTVLVPGLVGITVAIQGLMAVMMPLLLDLAVTREIEDRALAPVPIWVIGVQKIVSAAVQAAVAGAAVFPIVLLVHAKGQAPSVHVHNWPLFLSVLLLSCLLAACVGLLLGTIFEVRKAQQFFAVIVTPLTMLGCVYYPWSALHPVRWLQIVTLGNPVVYMSEGLRAALTPELGHMPTWAYLLALVTGVVLVGAAALRMFTRRVMD